MNADDWITALIVTIIGFIGGFVNIIITGKGHLRLPGRVKLPDNNDTVVELGWIRNVIVGGSAAFAVWGIGLGNPNPPQVYATALLSGLGGARILNDLLEKQALNIQRNHLAKELKELVEELKEKVEKE